jgi:hypothetical protein
MVAVSLLLGKHRPLVVQALLALAHAHLMYLLAHATHLSVNCIWNMAFNLSIPEWDTVWYRRRLIWYVDVPTKLLHSLTKTQLSNDPQPALSLVFDYLITRLSKIEEMLAVQLDDNVELKQLTSAQSADVIRIPKSFTVSICQHVSSASQSKSD